MAKRGRRVVDKDTFDEVYRRITDLEEELKARPRFPILPPIPDPLIVTDGVVTVNPTLELHVAPELILTDAGGGNAYISSPSPVYGATTLIPAISPPYASGDRLQFGPLAEIGGGITLGGGLYPAGYADCFNLPTPGLYYFSGYQFLQWYGPELPNVFVFSIIGYDGVTPELVHEARWAFPFTPDYTGGDRVRITAPIMGAKRVYAPGGGHALTTDLEYVGQIDVGVDLGQDPGTLEVGDGFFTIERIAD